MYKVKISFECIQEDYLDVNNLLKDWIDLCAYKAGQITVQSIQVEYQIEYLPDKQLEKEAKREELRDHD